jgi:hypothetical protein
MRIDELEGDEFAELKRRVRDLEMATPLNNSSMGRGELYVDGGTITIANGGNLAVAGTVTVTGTETVSGTMNVSGTENVTGTLNVNGPANITGATTLTGNLAVNSPGKITTGALTLSSTAGNGDAGIGSTGSLGIVAATTLVLKATSILAVGTLSPTDIYCSLTTTTSPANMYCSPTTGHFQLVTSAARFKIDPQPMDLPDSLLAVPVKDWIDRGAHERGESGPRVPGIIAEEVAAAGGEQFVTYGPDGTIQGVAYDRLALARTEILARKLDAAMDLIADLQKQLAK